MSDNKVLSKEAVMALYNDLYGEVERSLPLSHEILRDKVEELTQAGRFLVNVVLDNSVERPVPEHSCGYDTTSYEGGDYCFFHEQWVDAAEAFVPGGIAALDPDNESE